MKKKVFVFWIGLFSLLTYSCEKVTDDFGDKELPSDLELISITDSVGGYDFGFVNPEPTDTTYVRYYLKRDSVFLADGSFDKLKTDTVYYEGKTAKLYSVPMVLLPKYKNRLYLHFKSNARWTAPTIPFNTVAATWIKNYTVAGIGEAIIEYEIKPRSTNPNSTISTRRKPQVQYITTRDSSVMYKIHFSQKSMVEE